jgi:hypothetical protein
VRPTLRRRLQRARLPRAALSLLRRREPEVRRRQADERRALAESLPSVEHAFGDAAAAAARDAPRTVLVPGWNTVRHVLLQAPVLGGFLAAGYEPVVMLYSRERVPVRLYRALGVRRFVWFDRFDHRAAPALAASLLEGVADVEALIELEHDGVRVGRYAAATLLRRTRRSSLDLGDPATHTAVERALLETLDHTTAIRRILADVAPDAALLVDRGYTPEGPLFDLCLTTGIVTYTWNAAHRDNTLLLRRYDSATKDAHPAGLSDQTWRELLAMPWDDRHRQATLDELRSSYASGEWYGEVGTQFRSRLSEGNELRAELGLDERPVAGIFPHIFWDATYFWGTDLFEDYQRWFVEAVQAAYANDRVQWVIKVHPANIVKNARDGIVDEPAEETALRAIGSVPDHIRVLPADTAVATLSLLEILDYCCTVRGTVGLEAAALGATVITAGTGRYDHLGFTLDPATREELRATLDSLPDIPFRPDVDTALRYAYGVLLVRPLRLRSVSARFRQDEAATLDVRVAAVRWDDLQEAADIRAIADWLGADRPDLVDRDRLAGTIP